MSDFNLGLLEFGIRRNDQSSMHSLLDVLDYAGYADRLGFRRFWFGEHHQPSPRITYTNPLVILPVLLQQTERIRVGTAGVLLNYYSAYNVATNFKLLANMFPGRCELGFAAGAPSPVIARDMWHDVLTNVPDHFEKKLGKVASYFRNEAQHLEQDRIVIPPAFGIAPDLFALGSSFRHWRGAVDMRLNMAKSILHSPRSLDHDELQTITDYRAAFAAQHGYRPAVVLALAGACRRTGAEIDAVSRLVNDGHAHLKHLHNLVIGRPAEFNARLTELSRRYAIDDFVLLDVGLDNNDKIAGLEALTELRRATAPTLINNK